MCVSLGEFGGSAWLFTSNDEYSLFIDVTVVKECILLILPLSTDKISQNKEICNTLLLFYSPKFVFAEPFSVNSKIN